MNAQTVFIGDLPKDISMVELYEYIKSVAGECELVLIVNDFNFWKPFVHWRVFYKIRLIKPRENCAIQIFFIQVL